MTVLPTIHVQAEDFDAAAEARFLTQGDKSIGAVVTFTGLCRDDGGTLSALELEHYPGMAEAELARIGAIAIKRFSLLGLTAIHRYGKIATGENIVLVRKYRKRASGSPALQTGSISKPQARRILSITKQAFPPPSNRRVRCLIRSWLLRPQR